MMMLFMKKIDLSHVKKKWNLTRLNMSSFAQGPC